MQLPIRAAEISSTSPSSSFSSAAICEIGLARSGEWGANQVRLQLREVDFHYAVIVLLGVGFALRVGGEQVAVLVGQLCNVAAAGGPAGIGPCARRKGKTEVVAPNSAPMLVMVALPVALMEAAPGAEVFDDGVGAAGNGQLPCQVQDDVLGRGPAVHLAGETHADEAGIQHLPRQSCHDFHRIGPAHAHGDGAEAARPWVCGSPCQSIISPG